MGNTVTDWNPLFAQLQGQIQQWGQRNQYQDAIKGLIGSPQFNPVQVTPQVQQPQMAPGGPQMPNAPGATPISDPARAAAAASPVQSYSGPLGRAMGFDQASAMAPLLQGLDPSMGFPLLLQSTQAAMDRKQKLADAKITPMSDADALARGLHPGGVYGTDAAGNTQTIQAPDSFNLSPGQHHYVGGKEVASAPEKPTPNEPFNPDGSPNSAYQKYQRSLKESGQQDVGWQVVNDPTTNQPYRYNSRTAQATDMQGKPIQVGGYGKIATSNPRTAVAIYMEQWKRENPQASADQTLSAMNRFAGEQSENHALGTMGAKVESANAGLDTVIDQAKAAYSKLPRGQFVPFNKLSQMALTNAFSSPEQADAYAADTGAINLWGKSINPNGVLTVEAQKRGEAMLNQAQSPEAHAAVLERMRAEGAASKGGIDKFRAPQSVRGNPATPAAPAASGWSNFRAH